MIIQVFILIVYLSLSVFAQSLPLKNQDVSPLQLKSQNIEIVQLVAKELAKDLPKKVDKYTNFTEIKAVEASLIYTFEINTGAKSDDSVIKNDKKRMGNGVINGVCQSSKRFMDAQITIVYIYKSSKTKKKLFTFDVNQQKCFDLYGAR